MDYFEPHNRLHSTDQIGTGRHICVQTRTATVFPLHWHNYFEIEIVIGGSGTHILNGAAYSISQGDAYLLTPTDFHRIVADSSVDLINISFDGEMLTEQQLLQITTSDFPKAFHFEGEAYERLWMAAQLLQHECQLDGSCTQLLCTYLLQCFVRNQSAPQLTVSSSTAVLSGIKRAILYLELHFREPITLLQLAEQAGFHPTYFSELFRTLTGETYTQRLNTLRIGYARALLANGFSVSDACFASGFGSLSNFLTTFKKHCHTTPSAYRSSHATVP